MNINNLNIKFWVLNAIAGIILFFIAGFLISTGFTLVDYFLVEGSWYSIKSRVLEGLPFFISTVIILYPILLFLLKNISIVAQNIGHNEKEIDKLSYFIIFLILIGSGALVIVPSIFILTEFIQGDLSIALLFKVLIPLVIGLSSFYYYFGILKGERRGITFRIAVSAFVIALVVLSLIVINPLTSSEVSGTHENLSDFERIVSEVDNKNKTETPENLDDLYFTNNNIEYTKTGNTLYQLCAEFEELPRFTTFENYPYSKFDITEMGTNCFDFEI